MPNHTGNAAPIESAPSGRRAREILLLLAVAWVALAAGNVSSQPPPETPPEGSTPQEQSAQEVFALLDYGKILYLCQLPDYAMPMFSLALDQTKDEKLFLTRVRVQSEAAIFACKFNQPELARPLADAVRDKISTVNVPLFRSIANLAVGYGALVNRLGTPARTQAEEALREALQTGRADLEGDALVLLGKAQLEERNATDAMQTAQKALQAYTRAEKNLEKVEVFNLIADCHMAQKNPAAAGIVSQKARDVIQDVGEGPLLNLQKSLRDAPEMMAGHIESAQMGNFEKAFNEVLSLLILYKFQYLLSRQAPQIRELNLSEPLLLAYAGHYAHLRGARLPGRVFIALADNALPKETVQRNKVEYLWALAKYWRMAGNTAEAARQLDKADQAMKGLSSPDMQLEAGLLEEKGLALLQLGRRDQAVPMLSSALDIVSKSGPAPARERLEFYLGALNQNELTPEILSDQPGAFAAALRRYKRGKVFQNDPPHFRSPFLSDAPAGQPSAAAAIAETTMPRPASRSAADVDPSPYIQTGRWAKAISIIEAALDEQGDSVERLQLLGECYFNMNEWEKAEAAFQRVLKLDPSHRRAAAYLQNIESQRKRKTPN